MTHSEQLNELAAALAKAQAKIEGAKKDSANPFFKSHYADLASVWDACRKQLTDNGLSVTQMPYTDGPTIGVQTVLMHASGQWMESTVSANAKDLSPQAVGSVITYLRRYALSAVAGVPQVDDDAEAGEGRIEGKPESKPTRMKDVGLPAQQEQSLNDKPCKVVDVEEKTGKGKTYWVITLSDGRKPSTLDRKIADLARSFQNRETLCEAVCVKNDKGYLNLTELAVSLEPSGPDDPIF